MRAQTAVAQADTPNYKSTLNLPQTDFPMRAGLATLEPELLAAWEEDRLYAALRAASTGRQTFTLHDGPPYANGHLHMGHALNKVLKDMVVRARQMSGLDARFVPGWDCHGLPVEWKVEEQYREKGLDKDDVPTLEFRQACRDYAAHWVDVQREEFKRLGVNADWDTPYLTMENRNEAAVAREFLTFLMNGTLYQSSKPVMWSPVEKTALAEAEVEYHDRKADAVWVGYEVASGGLEGAFLVAWTTTPWTLPASQAVCFAPDLDYALYVVACAKNPALLGQRLVLADLAAERTASALGVDLSRVCGVETGSLEGLALKHPLGRVDAHWARTVPAHAAGHVRGDAGTGFVHTAPDHGEDDYKWARDKGGFAMLHTLADDGSLRADMPVFGGLAVVRQDGKTGPANARVMEELDRVGLLFGRQRLTHSYPHSWRSKAPVLFRATPQWFVDVDKPVGDGQDALGTTLRSRALAALDTVQWMPEVAKNRLAAMLRDRPDWVLSRQRSWGVPLTLFLRRDLAPDHPDFVLRDEAVNARVLEAFEAEGADAWYRDGAKARFLAPDHDPDLYEQCFDVLDVWFESGSSHAFVLKDRQDGPEDGVADLYLEGTDQHRGWFQASLLQSVGTTGRAPFRAVLTHGFALDGKGHKMSKSVGNTVAPQDVVARFGADVLRLWVAQADHAHDFRAGDDAFKGASETFRKLRNTVRFMLGVLGGHPVGVKPERTEMDDLELWLMHRAADTGVRVELAFQDCDPAAAMQAVHDFAAHDLSAVYLDVRKDVLYCDGPSSSRRKAALDTLSVCLDACLSWMAPVLVFTAEDAWRRRHGARGVHLSTFPDLTGWTNKHLGHRMSDLLAMRDRANLALEAARKDGSVKKQSWASVSLPHPEGDVFEEELAELFKVAAVRFDDGLAPEEVRVELAKGAECPRCREVEEKLLEASGLCQRCDFVLMELEAMA